MNCEACGNPIPPERLEAKPDAKMCVPCLVADGDVPMKRGHMVFNHKTAGEVEIVSEEILAEINHLDPRGYKRGSGESAKDEDED